MNLLYLYIILLASTSLISGKQNKDEKQCVLQNQLKKQMLRINALEDKISEPPACPKESGVVELQAELTNQSMEIRNIEDKLSGELLTLSAQARHNVALIYNQIITSGDIAPTQRCDIGICPTNEGSVSMNPSGNGVETMQIFFDKSIPLKSVLLVQKTSVTILNIQLSFGDLSTQNLILPLRAEGLYLETFDLQPVTSDYVAIVVRSENNQPVEWAEINFFQI